MEILIKRYFALMIDMGLGLLISLGLEQGLYLMNLEFSDSLVIYLAILITILKDVVTSNGSIGKKIFNLKIISNSNEQYVSMLIRIARNITLSILFVEFIIGAIFKGRRLGDFIFNTKVVVFEKNYFVK